MLRPIGNYHSEHVFFVGGAHPCTSTTSHTLQCHIQKPLSPTATNNFWCALFPGAFQKKKVNCGEKFHHLPASTRNLFTILIRKLNDTNCWSLYPPKRATFFRKLRVHVWDVQGVAPTHRAAT
jgi:hypothetical protein